MRLRKLTQDDVSAGYRLTQQFRWPHRLEDWHLLLTLGEGYAMEHHGVVIGAAMAWRWLPDHASIGVVVVDKAWQGKGIGKQLMLALLDDLSGYHIRLHATEQGAVLYQQLGFNAQGYLCQYQVAELPVIPQPKLAAGHTFRRATFADKSKLEALELAASGRVRSQLYFSLLNQHQVFVIVDREENILASLGCHRYGHGLSLGPGYAIDREDIPQLLQSVLSRLSGEFVRLDIAEHLLSEEWFTQWQLTCVDRPQIMVRAGTSCLAQPTAIPVTVMTPALG